MVGRTVSGAHYGLRDWLAQRFTALVMFSFTLFLLGVVLLKAPDPAAWRALFGAGWMRYFTLLFALSLFWHAWIGMRNILMDYVHATQVRLTLHVAVIVALLIYAMWTVDILWGIR
jgi:succinate dehydrogenase / fumarate reductase membrane anchor subunit